MSETLFVPTSLQMEFSRRQSRAKDVSKVLEFFRTPKWHYQAAEYDEARTLSREHDTFLLMVFSGYEWCGFCQSLRTEVFETVEFGVWSFWRGMILLDVDFPANPSERTLADEKLRKQYRVNGFPTVILLDSKGRVRAREIGYASAGTAADWIQRFDEAVSRRLKANPRPVKKMKWSRLTS